VSDQRLPAGSLVRALQVPLGRPLGSAGRAGADVLSTVPLFSGLTKRQLRALADRVRIVRYGEGRTIIAEGGRSDAMYVLLEGTVRVVRGSGRSVGRMGPGELFGELSLLDGHPRSASVISVSPVICARLSRTAFVDLARSQPDFGIRVMEVLAARLRETSRRLDV
jgi:CRP/FNR family cyclic AMP-dependent transcriptional regulator